MTQDIQRSIRSLARQPLLSLVIIFTLAVGLGAATAMFSFFLESWTDRYYQGPDNALIVTAGVRDAGAEAPRGMAMSYPDFLTYRRGLEDLGEFTTWAFFGGVASLTADTERSDTAKEDSGGKTLFVLGQAVNGKHFEIFNATRMTHGRGFTTADDQPGSPPVAIIDHTFWQREFDSDPAIVGRTLRFQEKLWTVVGVAPEGFLGNGMSFNLFVPLATYSKAAAFADDPEARRLRGLVVPAAGVTQAAIEERFHRLAAELNRDFPLAANSTRVIELKGASEGVSFSVGETERMILAAVSLLLALAVINVANLLLVRAAGRRREMAVLAALGASRGRIVRRLLTESLLLALTGGFLGTFLAHWITDALGRQIQITPTGLGGWSADMDYMPIDGTVLLFAFGLSIVVGLAFGLAPIFHILRGPLSLALKGAGAETLPGGRRGRHALVVAQVAISTALLVGAGLLSHSLFRLQQIDPGYETDQLLIAAVSAEGDEARRLFREARDTVAALPGVLNATAVSDVPGTGNFRPARLTMPELGDEKPRVATVIVDPAFFDTLQIDVLNGRALSLGDHSEAPVAALVNEAFVKKYWSQNGDPVGRSFGLEGSQVAADEVRVVGLVRDNRHFTRREAPGPLVYVSTEQFSYPRISIVARVGGSPRGLMAPVRQALQSVDPNLAVIELDLHRRHLEYDLYLEVIFERLARFFGMMGLALAAAGIYSVISCLVSYRRREMGIRLAVGASAGDVVRLVLGGAMLLVGAGVALGLGGSLWLASLIESLLYGISPADPWTFGAVAFVLVAVGLLAAYVPARRAGLVDPLVVLREE